MMRCKTPHEAFELDLNSFLMSDNINMSKRHTNSEELNSFDDFDDGEKVFQGGTELDGNSFDDILDDNEKVFQDKKNSNGNSLDDILDDNDEKVFQDGKQLRGDSFDKFFDDSKKVYQDEKEVESNSFDDFYDQREDSEEFECTDWRSFQQYYVINRIAQQSRPARGNSRNGAGERLYKHASVLKQRSEARIKAKEEEEAAPKNLDLATRRSSSTIRSQSASRSRSSSVPRYEHLYLQGIKMKEVQNGKIQERERERIERNQLQLHTRSSSRPRDSGNHIPTKGRSEHLYEMSRKSQREGRERRESIERNKLESKPVRSVSVGRRGLTKPLNVRLYNQGLRSMKEIEMKRKASATERDDSSYKPPPILNVTP